MKIIPNNITLNNKNDKPLITKKAFIVLSNTNCSKEIIVDFCLYEMTHFRFDVCDLKYINSISVKLL